MARAATWPWRAAASGCNPAASRIPECAAGAALSPQAKCTQSPITASDTITDAATWIALATGTLDWAAAIDAGVVSASGARADLSGVLPVAWE